MRLWPHVLLDSAPFVPAKVVENHGWKENFPPPARLPYTSLQNVPFGTSFGVQGGQGGYMRGAMDSKRLGYVFTLLAIVIFSLQDAISKHLGSAYPPVFIAMLRFWAFGAFAMALGARGPGGLRAAAATKRPILQILRGVLLAVQIVLGITAFSTVGLAHSQAVLASGPIFVALLSMPLLGERVGWRRWTAIGVGLCGVLIVINPTGSSFDMGVLVPLAGALMFALYAIATRLASRDDAASTSFFYVGVAGVDRSFPPEQSARLAQALREAELDHQIENYVGKAHGWCVPDHSVYDHDGAERHWKRLTTLFAEALGGTA